ncbi:hypothetical protein KI659_11635 [Litoribacter alkaliphilus]|uniref:Porin n=1 Tax=Litoribacter ruber TaxID=702568 RepID=A0AAP2G4M3_9BACT|nr:hypothetical protein [Litoribacter alkaliphilus]MBS9524660.1 hypothetical protein [Litoribacter alkaliphilus]
MAVCAYAQDGRETRKVIDTLTYETQSGLPIAASKIYFTDSKFTISGYGESNFINYLGPKNTQSEDLELYMTNMQRFVAYAAYKPKKWLVLYAEIFAEYMMDGGRERKFEFMPEIFADFLISPKFNLRLGTHQATIGYLNNSDEPVMFYTVNRPEVERIIIPSTWIDLGIMTYGRINNDLKWSASIYQGLDPTLLNGATWIRRGRDEALRFNLNGYTFNPSLKYTGLKDTELAVNGILASMSQDGIRSNTHILSSYVRHNYGNWSFMALGAIGGTDNTQGLFELTQAYSPDNTGQVLGRNVYGYYAEVGYDILPFLGVNKSKARDKNSFLIKPSELKLPIFVRYERLDTHAQISPELMGQPFFQSDLTAITVGANFNPRRNVVMKTNYQFRNNRSALADGVYEGDRFEFGLGFIF